MNAPWLKFLPDSLRVRLHGRHNLQSIIGNTGWLFADKILRMGIGLVVGVWVARYLGPKQFGMFNYATAFVALFGAIAALGLDSIVVRDLVRYPEKRGEILGSVFILKLAGSVAAFIIVMTSIWLARPQDNLTHWLVGIVAVGMIFQSVDVIDFWFQARVQSRYVIYARSVAFIILSLVKVGLILLHAPLIAFAWTASAEVLVGAAGLIIVGRGRCPPLREWQVTWREVAHMLKTSWPLILSGIAIMIQARIDQVMIGDMLGDYELGLYSAAMRVVEIFSFLPVIIMSSVAPDIAAAKRFNEEAYHSKLTKIYRLMFILFIAVFIPLFFLGDQIVSTLFGEQYRAAGILLSLLSVRLFFANFGMAKGLFITNEGLFKYSLVTAFVGMVTNVILNYALIPEYKSIGAIIAATISFLITTFIMDLFYVRTRSNLNAMLRAIATPWRIFGGLFQKG